MLAMGDRRAESIHGIGDQLHRFRSFLAFLVEVEYKESITGGTLL